MDITLVFDILSIALFFISSVTSVYTFSVVARLLCPRIDDTVLASILFFLARVAKVCLNICGVI